MLRQIQAFTRKEMRIWLQQPGKWAVIFLTPLIFIWIMGVIFGSSSTPTVAVYAVNEDAGKPAQQALEALQQSNALEITLLPTRTEADQRIGSGSRMAAVILPAGFSAALNTPQGAKIELLVDPAQKEKAAIVTGLVQAALSDFRVNAEVNRGVQQGIRTALGGQQIDPGVDTGTLEQFLTAALNGVVSSQVQQAREDPLVQVDLRPAGGENISRPPTLMENLVPGYILMFGFFLVGVLVDSILEERTRGTLRRLLVSPTPRAAVLIGKTLPIFLLGVSQIGLILLLCHWIFGVSLGNAPLALMAVILCTASTMVGVGVLIAGLAKSANQASGMTNLLVLLLAASSGCLFPGIRIPGVELVTPHYWAIHGLQAVIVRGMGLEGVLLPCAVLLAIAAASFTIGALRFRLID